MQFLVIAHDHEDALERRLACRQDHVRVIDELKAKGHFQHGGAILNDSGHMAGSVLVCTFDSRQALDDDWLAKEPYILNQVWQSVEIFPYCVGPSFQ